MSFDEEDITETFKKKKSFSKEEWSGICSLCKDVISGASKNGKNVTCNKCNKEFTV